MNDCFSNIAFYSNFVSYKTKLFMNMSKFFSAIVAQLATYSYCMKQTFVTG